MINQKDNIVNLQNIGGSWQLKIDNVNDLASVLLIDPAHWAMTAIHGDAIRCDRDFLALMQKKDSKRIHVDEVKELVSWLLNVLSDYSSIINGKNSVLLSSLNLHDNDAVIIKDTIISILKDLHESEDTEITLEYLDKYKEIINHAKLKGDGVFSPDSFSSESISQFLKFAISVVGATKNHSGMDGLSQDGMKNFLNDLQEYEKWKEIEKTHKDLLYPYGAEPTIQLANVFWNVQKNIDQYFESCAILRYTAGDNAKTIKNTYDPLDKNSVNEFFGKAPLAPANQDGILYIDEKLNPRDASNIHDFMKIFRNIYHGVSTELHEGEWISCKEKLSFYLDWISKKNNPLFDSLPQEKITEYLNPQLQEDLLTLYHQDEAVAENLKHCELVKKLILCQQNMRLFLNNFVSMRAIFSKNESSLLLAGKLLMDGRHFDLSMVVTNIAAHKVIAEKSNICIMYLEIVNCFNAIEKKMNLAVAVTSGSMKNLFIGKMGIFYSYDGTCWDAKIIDFIRQPVSVKEVLCMPYFKLADLIHQQTDKFFSAKSKNFENNAISALNNKMTDSNPPPAPEAPKPATTNGATLLMNGGIGIAAIGSAFAFITNTLKDVSFMTILSVFLSILIIFGAPFLIINFVKLFTRSFTLFFEANGCSMNRKMRMSIALGKYFTYIPELPEQVSFNTIFNIPYNHIDKKIPKGKNWILYLLLILLILFAYFTYAFMKEKSSNEIQMKSNENTAVSQNADSNPENKTMMQSEKETIP